MQKIFGKFDENGICRNMIRSSDPSIVIPEGFEEIKEKGFNPRIHRKTGRGFVELSLQEMPATQNITPPQDVIEEKLDALIEHLNKTLPTPFVYKSKETLVKGK